MLEISYPAKHWSIRSSNSNTTEESEHRITDTLSESSPSTLPFLGNQISRAESGHKGLSSSSTQEADTTNTSQLSPEGTVRPAPPGCQLDQTPPTMNPMDALSSSLGNLGARNPSHPEQTMHHSKRRDSLASSTPSSVSGMKSSTRRAGGHGSKIGFVQESASALRKRSMAEIGAGVYQSISNVSYVNFLEWIKSERLTTLPHEGSRWDRVLIRALHFAEQLHQFEQAIQGFAVDASSAATIGYGHAQLLLELGHDNSEALDKAFSIFYKFEVSFSSVLHCSEKLAATPEIREQLCLLYTDLLSLVVDVAIRYYKVVKGMTSTSVSFDIFEEFGTTIESFRNRQNSLVETIWACQIDDEGLDSDEALDVHILNKWLAPQDKVVEMLERNRLAYGDQQAELTCIWFQKHLAEYLRSTKDSLVVTAPAGGGKTTLAGSVVERLQRPINRKQYDTLICSLSPDIPTTATSIAVVKSLLFQLLNLRVGDMGMYFALIRAYEQCRHSSDLKAYEDHLWRALDDTLKRPRENNNELVIIVDGLDEIVESQSASTASVGSSDSENLLKKLASTIHASHGTHLIAFSSRSVNVPALENTVHYEISRDDVRKDLHVVALRALANNHHFHSQKGYVQEAMLDRLIQTAYGSFLWTILACQILNTQTSQDSVERAIQTLESKKPSVQDLVLDLFGTLKPSNEAKLLLSWVLAAERPLTVDEIHTLFTIDVNRGTFSDPGVDVAALLNTMSPLITLHEDGVVRFKHPIIHSTLHKIAGHSNVSIPLKDSERDLLLRILHYARLSLREQGEPTMSNLDTSLSDRLFRQHNLLEYTVLYWPLHLQQSSLAPTSRDYKPTSELQKAVPGTVMLPLLEQICWDTRLPIPQALNLLLLVASVRRSVYTENHPSVLQNYLAIATSYLLMSKPSESAEYFYRSSNISQNVLGYGHPLTIESANYFIKLTDSMTSTSRTEIMTHREKILILLITAYERQHGVRSEMVIQTQKMLAGLYSSMNEDQKAKEVYRQIQDATIHQYGRDSHQAQSMQSHLKIVLGKGKKDYIIEGSKDSLLQDENEEGNEAIEVRDIESIDAYLQRAEALASKKEYAAAERTYVELWVEISSRCRTVQSVEWHEQNIAIATAYSRYLRSQKRTSEASAILSAIWQQYEGHRLSYTEQIISQLNQVAKEMKSVGMYASALSIFKHCGSFYQNSQQQGQTAISHDVNHDISETSLQLVHQCISTSSTNNAMASESVVEDGFFSMIQSSKEVDSRTLTLAKDLATQYMGKKNYAEALKVINATLQRIWSSFLSDSVQNITLDSAHRQESIELVELLAECYSHTKQTHMVERTYSRLFRACLGSRDVDRSILEKAQMLLISFYDTHRYTDNAIAALQDLLVAYRTRYGDSNELTIGILYDLAERCQTHPRTHPYWIEYYMNVLSYLNKDSDVCHKDALRAIVVVTNTYFEDRRFAEAVPIYRLLWNTFIKQTTQHKTFSDTHFVKTLYERFYRCLEETDASYETLFDISKQYHDTCVAAFGAQSAIAIEASLSLARVAKESEAHSSTAIALYEELSHLASTASMGTSSSEIHQALSSLYVSQLHSSSSSSSMKAETLSYAVTMTQQRLDELLNKYGYSHESSLATIKELAMLYHRQKKTDAATSTGAAIKLFTTAISEIVSKETSSQRLIESAASIASSFQAIEQSSTAESLVQELHRQIIAKESRYGKWSLDLTKSGRLALAFLASFQYSIRRDMSITFAETMADLTMEYIYFENFRGCLQKNESLANILQAAAPLRYFLRRNKQQDMVSVVDDQATSLFTQRDTKSMNLLTKDAPKIFVVGILDHLGNGRSKNFNRSVILSSNESLSKLTKANKFPEAYDIANLGFLYANKHDMYRGPNAISMGFKLASLLAGRDGSKCPDANLHRKMIELSNKIVHRILDTCDQLNINFAEVQLNELSQLTVLLAEQQDWGTLEWLLTKLWNTRDAQRSWPQEVLQNLGRRLICARFLAGHPVKACRLAEDIAYNSRRTLGSFAPNTIQAYELLAQLYTSTAQSYQATASSEKTGPLAQEYFKKALEVPEDILRLIVNDDASSDNAMDEQDTTATLLASEGVSPKSLRRSDSGASLEEPPLDKSAVALKNLHLLKLAYQRLGHWPKPYAEYERLNSEIFRAFGDAKNWKGMQGTEKWDAKKFGDGKAESKEGAFEGLRDWALGSESVIMSAKTPSQVAAYA